MASFSDFETIDIYKELEKVIKAFEKTYNAIAVCGQIGGGRSMGLSNNNSDNDFDVYYISDNKIPFKKNITTSIKGQNVKVEFNYCKIELLINAAEAQISQIIKKYPSCLYRSESDLIKIEQSNKRPRWERDDYYFTKFHWLMMSDDVWVRKNWIEEYEKMYEMERVVDAADYYYMRAYGNYKKFISQNDVVNYRRYLNCIWQILSCEWLVTKLERPPVKLDRLINIVKNENAKKIICDYQMNYKKENIDKSELLCRTNETINNEIGIRINYLEQFIERLDRNVRISDVVNSNEYDYKRNIYIYDI